MFPFFITKRFLISRKDSRFFSFISVITITGIALGVASLLIALSILNGFERTITEKIIEFDAHIKINSYTNTLPDYHTMLPVIENHLGNHLQEINIYASSLAVITSKKSTEGINLIGAQPSYSNTISKNIVEGTPELNDLSSMVIGRKLADKIFVKIGDKVTLFTLRNDQIPSADNLPGIQNFVVSGIFESGMAEYDDAFVYINLSAAQDLLEIGDNINGYDIRLNNIAKTDSLKDFLQSKLKYPHRVSSMFETHRNIFTWIELQKKPIPIILGLIILVAVFNIIGTLLMMILEKTKAIGTLKSLGAGGKQIVQIFLLQGSLLSLIGIIAGNIIGFSLMQIQLSYDIITIPSSVYFMSSVPINMTPEVFIGVSIIAFILSLLASIIPSIIASRINPVSTLRFD